MVQRKKAFIKEKAKDTESKPTAHQRGLLQWKAYRKLEQALEQPMTKHDISAPEWKLLGLVFDRGEMQATEVAFLMDVKLPLVTRNVTTLKNKKLIAIENHKEDRRIKLITVTVKGKEKLFAIEKDVRVALGNVFQGVTKDEMQQYKNVLKKIVGNN